MFDDLFDTQTGNWYDGVSDDCQRFLNELADVVVDRGEPTWAAVLRHVKTEFPDDAPKTITPIQRAIRELVAERG